MSRLPSGLMRLLENEGLLVRFLAETNIFMLHFALVPHSLQLGKAHKMKSNIICLRSASISVLFIPVRKSITIYIYSINQSLQTQRSSGYGVGSSITRRVSQSRFKSRPGYIYLSFSFSLTEVWVKRKRSDSVLWQKPIHPQKNVVHKHI